MIRGIATPLVALLLILVMELMSSLLAQYWWYSPAFVLLYAAFLVNAIYDCGRLANLTTAFMISAYVIVTIPDQPYRAGTFIIMTFGLALFDGWIKQRIIRMARDLERAIQENNRKTLEIRHQNEILAEIAQLGEVQPIINRVRDARNIINDYAQLYPDERLGIVLHKLNNAELSLVGWIALERIIKEVSKDHEQQY